MLSTVPVYAGFITPDNASVKNEPIIDIESCEEATIVYVYSLHDEKKMWYIQWRVIHTPEIL